MSVFGFHLDMHSLSILADFTVSVFLGRRKEAVGHVEGPSGSRIMVVPAPYVVPIENLNTNPK
jgi:hypothetical protein